MSQINIVPIRVAALTQKGCYKAHFKFLSFILASMLIFSCATKPSGSRNTKEDFSLEPRSVTDTVRGVVKKLEAGMVNRGSRLAVATFFPTGSPEKETNSFGEYISDTLSSAIRSMIPHARLYERKRIDLILNENQLAVSGLVDEKQALKLGELVPIDALLVGAYTAFEAYVDVNARLVDISTGQILFTQTVRIKVDSDLAILLGRTKSTTQTNSSTTTPQKTEKEICEAKQQEIKNLLNDLSSQDKVKNVVRTVTAISLASNCGTIHYNVMSAFRRYKIMDSDYRAFLLKGLMAIPFPSNDERAEEIVRYISIDGVDGEEWKTGLEVLKKSLVYDMSTYLAPLLVTDNTKTRTEEYYKTATARMDEFIALATQGKVGLPVAATMDQVFSELLDVFNYVYTSDNRPLRYLYEKFIGIISNDTKTRSKLLLLLDKMYVREEDSTQKLLLLDWISTYYHSVVPDEKLADDFFIFLKDFEPTEYKNNQPEELKKYPLEQLPVFLNKVKDIICTYLPLTGYPDPLQDRIYFCLRHEIECPGVVPTAKEAAILATSGEWHDRIRAVKMLEFMGPRAAQAEDTLVKMYYDEEGGSQYDISDFHTGILKILGHIRSTKPKSLELLYTALTDLEGGVYDEASAALAAIGTPAVPYLIRGLKHERGGVQYSAASALAKIGPAAKAALPEVKKLAQSKNRDLRTIALKAIFAISGDTE